MKRTWQRIDPTDTLRMVNPPEKCPLWVLCDITADFIGDWDDRVKEKHDRETRASKKKDRTRPWIVRTVKYGRSVNIGPRHERLSDALLWAEGFAQDVELTLITTPFAISSLKTVRPTTVQHKHEAVADINAPSENGITMAEEAWFHEYLAEGIHTAFRKASDHTTSRHIHKLISDLPNDEWRQIGDFMSSSMLAALKQRNMLRS